MDKTLREKAAEFAKRGYTTELLKDKTTDSDTVYIALNPELDGCMAQGDTPQEALETLEYIRVDYIEHLLEFNLPVPGPNLVRTKGPIGKSIHEVSVPTVTFPGFEAFAKEAVQVDKRKLFSVSTGA